MGILTTGFMAKYAIIQCCRLQSRQRSLLLQVNHAKKAVTNMEKMLKNQKNMQLQSLKNWVVGYQSSIPMYSPNTGADGKFNYVPGMSMDESVFGEQVKYQQHMAQLQAWQSQQAQAIEMQYEAKLESLLEPLKQDEEDLECDKQDVDNDLAYWQEIRNSYKQQSKEDIKSFVS